MIRSLLVELLRSSVSGLVERGELPAAALNVATEISDTRGPEHGDYAFNFALAASKLVGKPPRAVAELLKPLLEAAREVESVEIAGPGFLNLRLKPSAIAAFVPRILALGSVELPKQIAVASPKRINLEFVSVNPNGPITVGSARGAAFGDALASVLLAVGHKVDREYYINDGVNSEQMRQFGVSVARDAEKDLVEAGQLRERLYEAASYSGEYVSEVARRLVGTETEVEVGLRLRLDSDTPDFDWFRQKGQEQMLERQREDLRQFGVEFDSWFSEQALHDNATVSETIEKIILKGAADKEPIRTEIVSEGSERVRKQVPQDPGPTWFRSTQFGDDKDRVLLRSDGRPAYIAGDLAYMQDKLGVRNYDKAIIVLGPDHHGYIGRMNAVCLALGFEQERFEIVIFQIVRFVKDGKPAPMRKRDGNIYELRDLMEQLGGGTDEKSMTKGKDVARFFYLMRSHDTHLDFDIDLATKQSDENPVFYVQYAHARICSVLSKARETSNELVEPASADDLESLTDPRELGLIKKILDLPYEVARCAEDYGVHRLTTFAVELARTYHHFYDGCRVVQPDQVALSRARVAVCEATRIGLQSTLGLLGISAPQQMSREALAPELA